jgi:hypothetical protein
VAASRCIGKSARLRALLTYLCERVLQGGADEIHEHEVGHAVFARPEQYDTGSDNIVRVHASMLRKRLDQYFSSEGRYEPVVIELPKGNYAPVFRERVIEPLAPVSPPKPLEPSIHPTLRPLTPNRNIWIVSAIATIFAALSAFLLLRAKVVPAVLPQLSSTSPAVAEFWAQIFRPGHKTDIVMTTRASAFMKN